MTKLLTLLIVMVMSMGAACTTTAVKPASDLSGAGFVLESPNAWSRANLIANDRELAERIAVNRAACMKAPLCRK